MLDCQIPYSGLFFNLDAICSHVKILPQRDKLGVIPASVTGKSGKATCSLAASTEPATILSTRKRLQSVSFGVLNFQEFFGGEDILLDDGHGGGQRLGASRLSANGWHVDLTALPNLKESVQTMKTEGGYAVTHLGTLSRSDGSTFTVKAAESILEAVRLFLSYARGAFCSPVLHEGIDRDGNKVWEKWGSHMVAPWGYAPSWFDTMNSHLLSEVFPGFWNRLNDPAWEETIRTVLYWYLRSNTHGQGPGVDGGLVLTQAALERLSHAYLGRNLRPVSKQIRKALEHMRIPTNVPRSCRELRTLARAHGWQNSPHAMTEVRNELVHPRQSYGGLPSGSYYEAWNLGQRYIELMLLRLFGHRGYHANRLTQRWRGQVVRVPWA